MMAAANWLGSSVPHFWFFVGFRGGRGGGSARSFGSITRKSPLVMNPEAAPVSDEDDGIESRRLSKSLRYSGNEDSESALCVMWRRALM